MKCIECGEECRIRREDNSFDYAGTHCTFGMSGTYVKIDYVSDCCSADVEDDFGNILSYSEL